MYLHYRCYARFQDRLKYWVFQVHINYVFMNKILFKFGLVPVSLLIILLNAGYAYEKPNIRLGLLAFGTVKWELEALKSQQLLKQQPYNLEVVTITSPQAGKIALQSDAVDIIISDWIWVSRQRAAGIGLSFYPYSGTAGALMVAKDSSIHDISDLKQIKLGIAGGELDKNWLLLQALAKQQLHIELNQEVTKIFAAPPLLNQQLRQERIDAMINYWHYATRLEADGYRQLIDGNAIQKQLGIKQPVPTLGYVFQRKWAETNAETLDNFLKLTQIGKNLLCESDSVWRQIIPLTKVEQAKTQQLLRKRYCQGRITAWGKTQIQEAEKIYQLLKQVSDGRLTGKSETLQPDTFWHIE